MQQATVNLFADMGAQPGSLISGSCRSGTSTDTTPPTSTITSPTAGGTAPGRQPGHGHRHRDRRRRRRGRGRRSLDRRRRDLASGHAHDAGRTDRQLVLQLGRARQPDHDDQVARGRRQRATSRRRPPGVRSTSPARARSGARRHAADAADAGDASSVELGVKFTSDTVRHGHRHPLLQGRRPTPARTSAACGRRAASCSRRRRSRTRRRRAGSRSTSPQPVDDHPEHDLRRRRTSPRPATTPPRPYYFYTPARRRAATS